MVWYLNGIGMLIGLIFFWRGIKDGVFIENGDQPQEYKDKKMYGLRTDYFFYLVSYITSTYFYFSEIQCI